MNHVLFLYEWWDYVVRPLEKDLSSRWHCGTCLPTIWGYAFTATLRPQDTATPSTRAAEGAVEREKVLRLSHFVILIASWFMHLQVFCPLSFFMQPGLVRFSYFLWVGVHLHIIVAIMCGCVWTSACLCACVKLVVPGSVGLCMCACVMCLLYSHPLIDIPIRLAI